MKYKNVVNFKTDIKCIEQRFGDILNKIYLKKK